MAFVCIGGRRRLHRSRKIPIAAALLLLGAFLGVVDLLNLFDKALPDYSA
jgi:hypothetical protein